MMDLVEQSEQQDHLDRQVTPLTLRFWLNYWKDIQLFKNLHQNSDHDISIKLITAPSKRKQRVKACLTCLTYSRHWKQKLMLN